MPVAWVISAFLPDAMKTVSSELTEDAVALIRSEAVRWRENPPPTGFSVRRGGASRYRMIRLSHRRTP